LAYGAWTEVDGADYWKLAVSLASVGAWAAYVSTQSLARLAPQFRWSFTASFTLSAALTLVGLFGLWNRAGSGDFWRLLGALAVLAAASALVVPILHRASRSVRAGTSGNVQAAFCPRCGRQLSRAGACEGCGAHFEVRFREG
jgi:hypothetical protein